MKRQAPPHEPRPASNPRPARRALSCGRLIGVDLDNAFGRKAVVANLNIPYSAQYTTITREGHERPPPSFGASTLIWHLAISPHWNGIPVVPNESLQDHHARLATDYEETHRCFFERINELLTTLQKRGAFPPANPPQAFRRGPAAVADEQQCAGRAISGYRAQQHSLHALVARRRCGCESRAQRGCTSRE